MDKKPIRHLHFKLIKKNITRIENALQDAKALDTYDIKPGFGFRGKVFVAPPNQGQPKWVEFMQGGTKESIKKITNRSNAAIMLVKHKKRIFAVTFGHGRFLLKDDVAVPDFGIKTALNALQHDSIRSVDSFTFEEQTIQHRAQASKASGMEVFGLDVSKDILRAVTGKTRVDVPFESVSGKENTVALSVRAEFEDLKWICEQLLEIYGKTNYKEHFAWVDNVKRVLSNDLIEILNNKVVDDIKKKKSKCHLAPPEPIDWDRYYFYGFTRGRKELESDMLIESYKATLTTKDITIDQIKYDKVFAYSEEKDKVEYEWPVHKCIVFEATHENNTYVLTNGEWFEVEKKFARRIKKRVKEIPTPRLSLPKIEKRKGEDKLETEGTYNERVAKLRSDLILLDKKLVKCEYANTSVEICDLFSKKREFLHVKHRSGGSSAFSHLFAQGRVSAEALMADIGYRQEIRKKLNPKGPEWTKLIPKSKPRATSYNIIYVFLGISSVGLAEGLPFFSQLTLMRTYDDLIARGFSVSLMGIEIKS